MKKWMFAAICALILLVAGISGSVVPIGHAAQNKIVKAKDRGHRVTPPLCVGNRNIGKWAGVMRSVAKGQKCRKTEHSASGLATKDVDTDVDPVTPGPAGATGASGAPGAEGPQGSAGPPGASPTFQTTTLCVNKNNSVSWGGDDGKLCKPTCQMILTIVITGEQPPVPVTETTTTVE